MRINKRIFRPYQKQAFKYCLQTRFPCLFMEMRLGKTLVAIRAAQFKAPQGAKLVVAPFSAWDGWMQDLASEGHALTCIEGTQEQRRAILEGELRGWYIVNPEIWRTVPEIAHMRWDIRIADESTYLKNPKSKVSLFFNDPTAWRDLVCDMRLTGTPDPEGPLGYYSQCPWLWEEKNFWAWRFKWFLPFGKQWQLKPKTSQAFYQLLNKKCFFLTRKDAGIGGEKIYEKRFVKFTPAMQRIYTKLAREFVLEHETGTFETLTAGVKYSWLRRLCGGIVPNDDGTAKEFWDGKTAELVSILTGELKRDPVVIWTKFREEIPRIAEKLSPHGKVVTVDGDTPRNKRDDYVRQFQSGEVQWIVSQQRVLARGKDLSRADTEIYFSTEESYEIRKQSEDRMISANKTTPGLIMDLIVRGSVEEEIIAGLEKKESSIQLSRRILHHLKTTSNLV